MLGVFVCFVGRDDPARRVHVTDSTMDMLPGGAPGRRALQWLSRRLVVHKKLKGKGQTRGLPLRFIYFSAANAFASAMTFSWMLPGASS